MHHPPSFAFPGSSEPLHTRPQQAMPGLSKRSGRLKPSHLFSHVSMAAALLPARFRGAAVARRRNASAALRLQQDVFRGVAAAARAGEELGGAEGLLPKQQSDFIVREVSCGRRGAVSFDGRAAAPAEEQIRAADGVFCLRNAVLPAKGARRRVKRCIFRLQERLCGRSRAPFGERSAAAHAAGLPLPDSALRQAEKGVRTVNLEPFLREPRWSGATWAISPWSALGREAVAAYNPANELDEK